jgi:ADP-ribose pyrophosphatase YjhB (NUDIX family)
MGSPTSTSREYPDHPLVGVGALIVRDNRIVLVRRGAEPARGEWSIPGGLVEVGETLKEAVAREALEETGLQVEPGDLVELLERVFLDDDGRVQYHFVLADFLCRVRGGELSADSDVLEAIWVDGDQIATMPLADVTRRVIMKAFSLPLAPSE